MTLEMWTDRLDRIQSFFGPGIRAEARPCTPPPCSTGQSCAFMRPVLLTWLVLASNLKAFKKETWHSVPLILW